VRVVPKGRERRRRIWHEILGRDDENGCGVAQDYVKAREWYQRAADAGNIDAMINLGRLYLDGKGVPKDYGKAREWYQKAADADPNNTYAKQALLRLEKRTLH
jgi:TPR repeat protein